MAFELAEVHVLDALGEIPRPVFPVPELLAFHPHDGEVSNRSCVRVELHKHSVRNYFMNDLVCIRASC